MGKPSVQVETSEVSSAALKVQSLGFGSSFSLVCVSSLLESRNLAEEKARRTETGTFVLFGNIADNWTVFISRYDQMHDRI